MKTDNISLPKHDYLTETRLLRRLTGVIGHLPW